MTLHLQAGFDFSQLSLSELVLLAESANLLVLLPDLVDHVFPLDPYGFDLNLLLLLACLLVAVGRLLQEPVLLNQLAHLGVHHLQHALVLLDQLCLLLWVLERRGESLLLQFIGLVFLVGICLLRSYIYGDC